MTAFCASRARLLISPRASASRKTTSRKRLASGPSTASSGRADTLRIGHAGACHCPTPARGASNGCRGPDRERKRPHGSLILDPDERVILLCLLPSGDHLGVG